MNRSTEISVLFLREVLLDQKNQLIKCKAGKAPDELKKKAISNLKCNIADLENSIDILKKNNYDFCNNCQGGGCPVCCGSGYVSNPLD